MRHVVQVPDQREPLLRGPDGQGLFRSPVCFVIANCPNDDDEETAS
jgi:hypothetical protein